MYFDPAVHRALRLKSAATDRTVSDIVNDALRKSFAEDLADLADARKRRRQPSISFESAVKAMKRHGQLSAPHHRRHGRTSAGRVSIGPKIMPTFNSGASGIRVG